MTNEERAAIRTYLKAAWKVSECRYDKRTDKWWVRNAPITETFQDKGWSFVGISKNVLAESKVKIAVR